MARNVCDSKRLCVGMIEIENLDFRYGGSGFRLRIPHLSIAPGSKVALVGASGAGKTTLLLLMAGVHIVKQGRVCVADCDLGRMNESARRRFRIRKIGFVFQDFELIEYLNVRENILLPYYINKSQSLDSDVIQNFKELAFALGLSDKLNRPIRHLSRGEQQRVGVCRALLPKPEIVLADEPTGSLDLENRRRVMKILEERAKQTGASLICVTHDLNEGGKFDRTIDISKIQTE